MKQPGPLEPLLHRQLDMASPPSSCQIRQITDTVSPMIFSRIASSTTTTTAQGGW